jgi:LuxR family maltose regulon positive regulatory protein
MQQYPLLQTKLHLPPIRPEWVLRTRLIERLNAGLPSQSASHSEGRFALKLTLISAPAGFGKTTLVSEWGDDSRLDAPNESQIVYEIAWLSPDEGDNDPARFLAYSIAALSRVEGIEATTGGGALGMLQSPGVAEATTPPPNEAVLTQRQR